MTDVLPAKGLYSTTVSVPSSELAPPLPKASVSPPEPKGEGVSQYSLAVEGAWGANLDDWRESLHSVYSVVLLSL
jgi:hypothetical protein